SAPAVLSELPPGPAASPSIPAAHRDGDLLYTAENEFGYRIYDITDPTDPIELAHLDADVSTPQGNFEAFVYDILVEGNTLYVAMSSGGFAIYDNTNIFAPTLLAHAPATTPPAISETRYREFIKEGNKVYIAAGDAGVRILSLDGCTIHCAIDYNNDGTLDFFDVTAFITAFNDMHPAADINNDNEFNFFDITAFIVAFQNGCP
ncbi:MAG: GC-type dockerin domain-anchored protein, partial [Phycisphaerales bacterium]